MSVIIYEHNSYDIVSCSGKVSGLDIIKALTEEIDPFSLSTKDTYIGKSIGVAWYAFPEAMYSQTINKQSISSQHISLSIDILETRFCKLVFNTGRIVYSFGNILGLGSIVVDPDDITSTLISLIGKQLKNVCLEIHDSKLNLLSYEMR